MICEAWWFSVDFRCRDAGNTAQVHMAPINKNAAVLNDKIRSLGPARETSLHSSIYSETLKLVLILVCACVCHVQLWLIHWWWAVNFNASP